MTPSCLLNTALEMPVESPLCQNPPSPMIAIGFLSAFTCSAEADEGPRPYPIVVAPMLNGALIENRWQPMSAAMWCSPSSFCTSVSAEKIGRSGQPVQKLGGRGGTTFTSDFAASLASTGAGSGGALAVRNSSGVYFSRNLRIPSTSTREEYSPAIGSTSFPAIAVSTPARRRMAFSACSRKSGWPSSTISTARLPRQNAARSSSTSG